MAKYRQIWSLCFLPFLHILFAFASRREPVYQFCISKDSILKKKTQDTDVTITTYTTSSTSSFPPSSYPRSVPPPNQCDQIWRNFATWPHFKKIGQNFQGLYCVWQNFKPTIAIFINFGQI